MGLAWIGLAWIGLAASLGCQQKPARQPVDLGTVASKTADSTTDVSQPNDLIPTDTSSVDQANLAADLSDDPNTIALFDGKTLDGWEVTAFGSEGECGAEDGSLIIGAGYPLSGVNSTRADLPTTNYEISLDVRRTLGSDFFCGLTFPVADSHCTLIVGGWAGPVVGLSCIDDQDASNNETLRLMKFETNRWYKVKVRVEPKRIQTWIDGELIVDQDIEGRKISLRSETLPTRPLGICNYETSSECKNIQLRQLVGF